MPYFISYLYGIILLFKVCNIKSILKQHPACQLESHILLVQQCHGGWNLNPSFWTWIQVEVNEMGPYNFLKEDEIQEFAVSWQNLGHILQVEEVFFWTSCLVSIGITVKSDHYIETPRHLNYCLHWVCRTRKMSVSSLKKKKACKGTIMPVTMHHRVPFTSGCRGWRTTITRQEYIPLYRGGRLLANVEYTLQNNYASSNDVGKFCKNFCIFSL